MKTKFGRSYKGVKYVFYQLKVSWVLSPLRDEELSPRKVKYPVQGRTAVSKLSSKVSSLLAFHLVLCLIVFPLFKFRTSNIFDAIIMSVTCHPGASSQMSSPGRLTCAHTYVCTHLFQSGPK